MEGEEGSKTESPKHGRASTKEQKKKLTQPERERERERRRREAKEKSRTPLPPMCSGVIRSALFSYYLTFRT